MYQIAPKARSGVFMVAATAKGLAPGAWTPANQDNRAPKAGVLPIALPRTGAEKVYKSQGKLAYSDSTHADDDLNCARISIILECHRCLNLPRSNSECIPRGLVLSRSILAVPR